MLSGLAQAGPTYLLAVLRIVTQSPNAYDTLATSELHDKDYGGDVNVDT